MTNGTTHIPEQHSAVSNIIIAALTSAMILVAGFLSLAQFAVVVS